MSRVLKLKNSRVGMPKQGMSIIKYTISGERITEGKIICVIDAKAYHIPAFFIGQKTIGIALDSFREGERLSYVESGVVTSKTYDFNEPFGRSVWIDCNGSPTDTMPISCESHTIGHTISKNTFFLNPKDYADNK